MNKKLKLSLARGVALTAALALAAIPTFAADHLDAPGLTPPGGDASLDITDIFAFQSPTCELCTVFVLGVNSLSPAGDNVPFSNKGAYEFRIDNDGDAIRDITFKIDFSKQRDDVQRMRVRMQHPELRGRMIVRKSDGRTTPIGDEPVVSSGRRGIRAFAGMRDDAFFFDLPGFVNLDFCAADPSADTFAGTNISYIALEVPNAILVADSADIGVWGVTRRGKERVDRMGRPGINTVLIPTNPINPGPSQKNAFNAGAPVSDASNFAPTAVETLFLLGNDLTTANALADFLMPDLLTLTLDTATGYPNGRNPADDVIDISLGLVTGGAIGSDCVDGNDVPLSDEFPFLGEPHV